jgi:plastocyanin
VGAGAASVTLENNGKEAHQAQLFKLNDGTDVGKLVVAGKAESPDLALDKLGTYVGGPDAVDPGETQVATSQLAPGNYAFICLLPDAKGRSHLSLGMVGALTVTANKSAAALPPAAANVSMRDFGFQLPSTWTGRIAVTNNGRQPHEYQILGIAPGKKPSDLEKTFKTAPGTESGPPPWTADGGLSVIAPGQRQLFDIDLKPGTYYLMCFVTDPQRKAPHFALGMMKRFRGQAVEGAPLGGSGRSPVRNRDRPSRISPEPSVGSPRRASASTPSSASAL